MDKDEPLEKVNLVWSSWRRTKFVKLLKSAPPKRSKDGPVSGYLNGDYCYPPQKQQNMKFGKWRLLRRLLNEKQLSDLYDLTATKAKPNTNLQGPFIFEQYDRNP